MFQPPLPDEISRALLHRSADSILGKRSRARRVRRRTQVPADARDRLPARLPPTDWRRTRSGDRRETLRAIVRGGIFDQVGRRNRALHRRRPLAGAALREDALRQRPATLHARPSVCDRPDDEWAHAIRAIADFLERDLATPDGTFASSLSADTPGQEGATYVWTYDELADVLSPAELALAEKALGVTVHGNWDGQTILTRPVGRESDAEAVDAILGKLLGSVCSARSRTSTRRCW